MSEFWNDEGDETEVDLVPLVEATETRPRGHRAVGARNYRAGLTGALAGLAVGAVGLGAWWVLGQSATPSPEGTLSPVATVTETSEPLVSVSTRRGWRTRLVEVPGPTETVTRLTPGPTKTVHKTIRPTPKPGPTVTITERETDVGGDTSGAELPVD